MHWDNANRDFIDETNSLAIWKDDFFGHKEWLTFFFPYHFREGRRDFSSFCMLIFQDKEGIDFAPREWCGSKLFRFKLWIHYSHLYYNKLCLRTRKINHFDCSVSNCAFSGIKVDRLFRSWNDTFLTNCKNTLSSLQYMPYNTEAKWFWVVVLCIKRYKGR